MQPRAPFPAGDSRLPEEISVGAGLALSAFAMLVCSGAIFRILHGLFAVRSVRALEGLAMAALGIFLLMWVARRAVEWRLSVAATSIASALYYVWRAKVAFEQLKRFGGLDSSGNFAERGAAASTALVLFIVAGFALAMHVRSSGDD